MAEFDLDTQLRIDALHSARSAFSDSDTILEAAEQFYGFLKGLNAKPERFVVRDFNVTVYTPFGDESQVAWLLEDGTDRTVYRDEDGSFKASAYDADELRSSDAGDPCQYAPVKAGREYVDPSVFDSPEGW